MLRDVEGNVLYYGDNLDVLRRHVRDESVDLVYLDPPFNSNANYNILFEEHGEKAAAQVRGVQVGPAPGGAAAAPVAPPGLIAASTINDQRIRVELFDPEGDER